MWLRELVTGNLPEITPKSLIPEPLLCLPFSFLHAPQISFVWEIVSLKSCFRLASSLKPLWLWWKQIVVGSSFWLLFILEHEPSPQQSDSLMNHKQMGFPTWCSGKEFGCQWGDVGDMGSIAGPGRSPGEGNGNPLQYPCLENSMDRGAWQATVHGVAKSQTWWKQIINELLLSHVQLVVTPWAVAHVGSR